MTGIIIKPTRREAESHRQESLANRGLSTKRYRGTARTVEEAHDLQRGLEKDGETFDKLWSVSGPEAKQAEAEVELRAGINPETKEKLHG